MMVLFGLLKHALELDIFNINFVYGSVELGILSLTPSSGLPRKGILARIASLIWNFLFCFQEFNFQMPGLNSNNPIIFCAASSNQMASLSSVAANVKNSKFVSFNIYGRFDDRGAERFPSIYIYILSFPFFALVLLKFFRSQDYKRLSFHYAFDQYLLIYGYYLAARIWFHKMKPAAIVFASDHNIICRTLTEAASCEGIPTSYIQHASVSEKFPPLFFDFALLEGQYALKIYEKAGPSTTRVFLIGIPKADAFINYQNLNQMVRKVGICTNKLDPLERVEELCEKVSIELPDFKFFLRPHPADKNKLVWNKLSEKFNMGLSDSKTESSFEFLNNVDAIVAGDSNILLEASLINVFPIYYDFAKAELDWYGFIRNDLVDYHCEPIEIVALLKDLSQHKPSVREHAKIYCATIGTCYDGRSSELASKLITQISVSGEIEKNSWRRIPNSPLEAYYLNPLFSKEV